MYIYTFQTIKMDKKKTKATIKIINYKEYKKKTEEEEDFFFRFFNMHVCHTYTQFTVKNHELKYILFGIKHDFYR